jgi:glycosyltransferase involved in cell wall biosynthesis
VGVTGLVHTRNSANTVERALTSLRWVEELIVVDMASDDGTAEIAERIADRVIQAPVAPRIDGVRTAYLGLASQGWIFVLDSDEYLAVNAAELVAKLIDTLGARFDAFAIPRYNYIAGQIMRGSGWYPDQQIRLFRQGTVRWTDHHHVAPTVVTGKHRLYTLTPPGCLHIHHLNYVDLRHFMKKQLEYALSDSYDPDPRKFDLSAYIRTAHERLAVRVDRERDGDLSHALALLTAWDAVIRGLVHWDRLDPRPPLGYETPLPPSPVRPPRWRTRLERHLRAHHTTARALRTVVRGARALLSPLNRRRER